MNRVLICVVALCVWVLGSWGCSSKSNSPANSAMSTPSGSAGASHDAAPDSDAAPDDDADAGSNPAADATLSALVPSVGAIVPIFSPSERTYTLRAPNGTTSVALTPTSNNSGASIQINGVSVPSGQASSSLALPASGALDLSVIVTAEDATTTATYTVHVSVQALASSPTIYSVGDSTMANYDPTANPNQRGWMQMFPEFITAGVSVANAAINGTSSKSFYLSATWDTVKAQLLTGDYVFIQFAHNDEKDNGIEGPGGIGTAAWGAYHAYLVKYVNEARALGAIPILVTPIVRLDWDGTSIDAIGCHDLTGNGTAVGDANYPEAMRDVATTLNVPLVDLTLATKALAEQYGPTDAKSILYIPADNTHLQVMGALSYAQLAVEGCLSLGLFSQSLNPTLGMQLGSSALDFGTRYLDSSLDRAFSVLGLSLTPDIGSVLVAAPAGFLVGIDETNLSPTLQLPYTLGALPPTTVYVRFQPALAQPYSDSVTLTPGTGSAGSVALSAAALEVPAGGTEVAASYALYSATSGASCTTNGTITCADETLVGLHVFDYSPLTTLLPAPTPVPTQRLSTTTGDAWPAESDVDPTRYAEFSVSAGANETLSIDTVSLYAGFSGGPTLGFRVQLSTADDFSAPTELLDSPDNASNTLGFYSFSPLVSVAPTQTLHVRVFPYSKTQATKKYLSLAAVSMHGVAY